MMCAAVAPHSCYNAVPSCCHGVRQATALLWLIEHGHAGAGADSFVWICKFTPSLADTEARQPCTAQDITQLDQSEIWYEETGACPERASAVVCE